MPERTPGERFAAECEAFCEIYQVKIGTLCEFAHVDRSVFVRWKNRSTPSPTLKTVERMRSAMDSLKSSVFD